MEKTAEVMAKEIKETLNTLTQELEAVKSKETATPKEVQDAQNALDTFKEEVGKSYVSQEKMTQTIEELKTQNQAEIKAFKESFEAQNKTDKTFNTAIKDAFSENYEQIKEFIKNKNGGSLEIAVKAPDVIGTPNIATTAEGVYAASQLNTYDPFLRDDIYLEQYFDVGRTNKPSLPYMTELMGEGDAALVAEGDLKPLIDVDFEIKYSQTKKPAGSMKINDEAADDFPWLLDAARNTLKRRHDIARQNILLDNTDGVRSMASPFNAALLTGIQVQSPQKYDAICALATAISVQSEGVFMPNVVFINNIDLLEMKLTKDGENNYLIPPFKSADGAEIGGIRLVARPTIPLGEFIIGDMRNVKLRNYKDYFVTFGWENDDIRRNRFTMIGESRFHFYVSANEARGIISGTFADVITAIT